MHVDEGRIQRLLDGELSASESALVETHVDVCDECADRLAAAARSDDYIDSLLRHLDHPVPAVGAQTVRARARSQRIARLRWAAGITLVGFGLASAAYAAPGSPLRDWVRAMVGSEVPETPDTPQVVTSSPQEFGGIAVSPGAGLTVEFPALLPDTRITVALHDDARVSVRAFGGPATFNDEVDGRVTIADIDPSASFEVLIPAGASRVAITIAGERVFLEQDGEIVTEAAMGADGRYEFTGTG